MYIHDHCINVMSSRVRVDSTTDVHTVDATACEGLVLEVALNRLKSGAGPVVSVSFFE